MHRHYWKDSDLELIGSGRAFEETAFVLPRQRLAIDGGWGRSEVFAQPNLFLSHLHMDHALGLPRYVVNRHKMGDGSCRVIVPAPVLTEAKAIVRAWQQAEKRSDGIEWIGVEPGDVVNLDGPWRIKAVGARHNIPCAGFILQKRGSRVREQFAHLESSEIGRLVREGRDPVIHSWDPVFAYSGDTDAGIFDEHPELFDVPVLLLECTFVESFHEDPINARGHIHWGDLCKLAPEFRNKCLMLTHFSRRYRPDQLWETLNSGVPDVLREKLCPLIYVSGSEDRGD